ncbi:MAG: hypothetical protein R3332_05765 [Pseudohongiellaceae bacterium]|nr:hypothetical protein [Pseudohongiellaceae bacterium]
MARLLCWLALVSFISACASTPETATEPVALTEDNFFQHINAERRDLADARLWIALADCGDLGPVLVQSEKGMKMDEALRTTAEFVDTHLNSSGANTYAIESWQWSAEQQLLVEIKMMICSD